MNRRFIPMFVFVLLVVTAFLALAGKAAGASSSRIIHRPGVVNVYAHEHYGPGDGKPEGTDFTICNRRVFAPPTQTQGFDNDIALVHVSFPGHRSPDPRTFELGAPRHPVQHCATVLVLGNSSVHLKVRISWPQRHVAGVTARVSH